MKNKLTSWLHALQLRQVVTIFLAGLVLVVGTVVSPFGYELQAQAAVSTPEARSFRADSVQDKVDDGGQSLKDKVEDVADTVREKLNLDEPLYPATKEFLDDIQGKTDDTSSDGKQARKGVTTTGRGA